MAFITATQLGCSLTTRLAVWISELIYMFGPRRYAKAWIDFCSAAFPRNDALLRQKLLVFIAAGLGIQQSTVRSGGGLYASLRHSGPIDIHWIMHNRNLLFYLANYVDPDRPSIFFVPDRLLTPIRHLVPDAHISIADTSLDVPESEWASDTPASDRAKEVQEPDTKINLRMFVRGDLPSNFNRMITQLSKNSFLTIVDSFPLADATGITAHTTTGESREDREQIIRAFEEVKLRYLPHIDARIDQSVLFVETPLKRFGAPDMEQTRAAILPVLQQLVDNGFPLAWKCEFENPEFSLLTGSPLEGKVELIGIEEPTELVCEYFDVILTIASREVAFNHHSKIYLLDELTAWRGPEPEGFRLTADGLLNATNIHCSRLSDSPLEEHMKQWSDACLNAEPEDEMDLS